MDLLRTRLIEWDLAPEETVGFFRTVSRMIYATDAFYRVVRTQAVERVQNHPEDFQFLFFTPVRLSKITFLKWVQTEIWPIMPSSVLQQMLYRYKFT